MNLTGPDIYNKFIDETRTRLARDHPELTPLQLLKEIGRLWEARSRLLEFPPSEFVPQPLNYSITDYLHNPQTFIAVKTEELLNQRLSDPTFKVESEPPISDAKTYDKYADDVRTWVVQRHPKWSVDQVIAELKRLWAIQEAKINVVIIPEPVSQPLYYSATNYPYSPQAFIAAKTKELLDQKLENTLSRVDSDPPISTAKTYDKYADDIRIWVVQRYPEWSVDQVIAELKRLWAIQEEKIRSVMTEVAPPGPIMRIPPPKDRRMTAPYDPFSAFATAMADATTRGARADAARLAIPPPIPPVLLTMEEAKPEGREVDWAKIISAVPKVLPPNKDERDILKAIMGVWRG